MACRAHPAGNRTVQAQTCAGVRVGATARVQSLVAQKVPRVHSDQAALSPAEGDLSMCPHKVLPA